MRRWFLLFACALATGVPGASHSAPDDWGVQRDPFDPKEIAIYKAILAKNPHDAQALARTRQNRPDLLESPSRENEI